MFRWDTVSQVACYGRIGAYRIVFCSWKLLLKELPCDGAMDDDCFCFQNSKEVLEALLVQWEERIASVNLIICASLQNTIDSSINRFSLQV